jgi:hypothetical protein
MERLGGVSSEGHSFKKRKLKRVYQEKDRIINGRAQAK